MKNISVHLLKTVKVNFHAVLVSKWFTNSTPFPIISTNARVSKSNLVECTQNLQEEIRVATTKMLVIIPKKLVTKNPYNSVISM